MDGASEHTPAHVTERAGVAGCAVKAGEAFEQEDEKGPGPARGSLTALGLSCGSGSDVAQVDAIDSVSSCETRDVG